MKFQASLVFVDKSDIPKVRALIPRVIDKFQVYLRDLRLSDLKAYGGTNQLREAILASINDAVRPAKVHEILFRSMVIQ